jgi:hypothetical protein
MGAEERQRASERASARKGPNAAAHTGRCTHACMDSLLLKRREGADKHGRGAHRLRVWL